LQAPPNQVVDSLHVVVGQGLDVLEAYMGGGIFGRLHNAQDNA
jgi:hypothetical protein